MSSCAVHYFSMSRIPGLHAHAEQEGLKCSRTGNCESIQKLHESHHGKWRSANEHAASSFLVDNSANIMDIPRSVPVVRNHTS